ncbi:MAG: hypothetical protein Q7R76_03245 [Candidatus Woesearchaeota archaeon]|nr:hypothetical protein [Candidatus Woesearchaeota archaeon]
MKDITDTLFERLPEKYATLQDRLLGLVMHTISEDKKRHNYYATPDESSRFLSYVDDLCHGRVARTRQPHRFGYIGKHLQRYVSHFVANYAFLAAGKEKYRPFDRIKYFGYTTPLLFAGATASIAYKIYTSKGAPSLSDLFLTLAGLGVYTYCSRREKKLKQSIEKELHTIATNQYLLKSVFSSHREAIHLTLNPLEKL